MTAPSLRALGTTLKTTTASPSFAAPAGAVSTDVIVVAFFLDDGRRTVTGVPTNFTLGSDMPQTNDATAGSPSHSLLVYWGRFSDVGAGPYGFTVSSSVFVEGRTAAIQGCVTSGNPIEAADGNTSGNTSVTTAPSVSATSTGTDRYAFYAATNWTGGAWTPPSGFTEQWDGDDEIITFDDKALPTAQTVTPQAVCAGNNRSNAWVGIFIPPGSSTVNGTASVAGAGSTTAAGYIAGTASPAGAGAVSAAVTQRAGSTPAAAGSATAFAVQQGSTSAAGAGAAAASAIQGAGAASAGAGAVTAPVTVRAAVSAAGAGTAAANAVQSATTAAVGTGTAVGNAGGNVTGTASAAGAGNTSASLVLLGACSPAGIGQASAAVRIQAVAAAAAAGSVTATARLVIYGTASAVGAGIATAAAGSKITPRPAAGTTARPNTGTTTRPYAGITARP